MSEVKLDREEEEILRDFEAGGFKSVLTPQRKKQLKKLLKRHLKKINASIFVYHPVI